LTILIVFGNEYSFLESELNKINKKFKNIEFIEFSKDMENLIDRVKILLPKYKNLTILLNIDMALPNEISKKLTQLKYDGVKFHNY